MNGTLSGAILRCWRKDGLSLSDALREAGSVLGDAVVLLYSPSWCRFALFSGGSLADENGAGVPTDLVFEARAFSERGELRWLHRAAGCGEGVFLSEAGTGPNGWTSGPELQAIESQDGQYLLWGQGLGEGTVGWSRLATARIGTIPVPVGSVASGGRVVLRFREYFGLAPGAAGERHGNVAVLEERLIGLSGMKEDRA